MTTLQDIWNWYLSHDLRFQIIVAFSMALFSVSIALTIIVLRLRARKAIAERKASNLIEKIEPIIMEMIYDDMEEGEWKKNIVRMRNWLNKGMYDFHSYARISDYLVELHQQLEGESAERIRKIYRDIGLPERTLELLKSGAWHQKVKAIGALSEFQVRNYLFEVMQYVDHPKRLVRDEAQFAAIVLG